MDANNKPSERNGQGQDTDGKENALQAQNSQKKVSKFSLTFCNPSPNQSRDCSKERGPLSVSQSVVFPS